MFPKNNCKITKDTLINSGSLKMVNISMRGPLLYYYFKVSTCSPSPLNINTGIITGCFS